MESGAIFIRRDMARSGKHDPVDVFRFDVRIISLSLAPSQLIRTARNQGLQFARGGFSSVTTPEVSHNTMQYRENLDNYSFRKIPGLAKFNQITLSRGVLPAPDGTALSTGNKDFYAWVSQVVSFNPAQAVIGDLTGTGRSSILRQTQDFRRDMIIIQRDREGRAAKRWYILNAWPVSYKGGTDLDANSESKSLETLTLEYEIAFELPSVAQAAQEFVANLLSSDTIYGDLLQDIDLGF
jgi:phage tail-like protein